MDDTKGVCTTSKLKIEDWGVSDVVSWCENKQLHKFIILFQKHHVTGSDLINLKLPFLDDYEHISVEEREVLLSEIYNLLHPERVHASEEDLTKIKSPADKKKYYAAIELAQTKSASLPRSSSAFVYPSHYSSGRSSSSSSQPSPVFKPRHKSESGIERSRNTKFGMKLADTKKRKTLPKVLSSPVKPMYDYMKTYGPHCVQCIELPSPEREQVTMAADGEGHVTIQEVPSCLAEKLHPGDRVIEINGHMIRPYLKKDGISHLQAMLNYRSPATLVTLTEHVPAMSNDCTDEKWQKLHTMLVEMRDTDSLPESDIVPFDQEQYLKHTNILQDQIRKLEEKVAEQKNLSETLQVELEDKDAVMHDLELSRDKAIEKLRQTRSKVKQKNTRESVGGAEYYNMTMTTLDLENASKEQVVNSLKEIVSETSKQKWYLDRLISLIIEESPWLLDEVDSEFDSLTLTDQTEEFC
ncbi:uncharacterized protein LOC123535138 [Mercenaria mercenaria]|uniref:uncharacterized protein LOC123535138 n=1 Tax=Mercenaria mercenaria TaxID=6596 RepID=UPI00234FA748|nr:uncharacterized protein LOC123535138 [Mercenaria mercenaria]